MNRRKLYSLVAGAVLLAIASGCDSNANTNVTVNANANGAATNANTNAAPVTASTNNANGGSAYNRNYNTREEYERENANYRTEARNRNESIGQGLEDGWIHFKTRAALAAAEDLRDSTINVDVDNNVVTLRGTVATAAQKTKAVQTARGVEGVRSVTDRLTVNADASVLGGNANGNANRNANR
jgi:hypothetical protein